jgi:hypothetical protein
MFPLPRIRHLLFVFVPLIAAATTYRVGPARPYQQLQQIVNLLNAGDTVLVDGDAVYPGGVSFSRPGTQQQRILLHGIRVNGNRPILDGGTNTIAFTGGPGGASHYTLEGFEVRNATFRGIYHQASDLVVRDVVVHHCNNGLMGADQSSGSLLLEYAEFYACGSGTNAHQIYMATDELTNPGSVFRMQFCWIHDGAGGNNVKSRAERNEIYYNWIEGAYYHELELIGPDPAGGVPATLKQENSDVVGNVLQKRATAFGGTGTFYVVRFGGDGTGASNGRYRFVNNTVLLGTSAAFRLFDSLESVEMHNNVFYRASGTGSPVVRTVEAVWKSGGEQISGQNNWVQAGLTAVPSQWTGTISGIDPQFSSLTNDLLSPAAGSPLIGAGTSTPQSPLGFPFPSPLFPPVFHPPQQTLLPAGTAETRPSDGAIDIGAYEYAPAVDVHEKSTATPGTRLEQNFPNPFNGRTTIRFVLAGETGVDITVFDLLGKQVAHIPLGRLGTGPHAHSWEGGSLPTGVYLCRLQAGSVSLSAKFLLVR